MSDDLSADVLGWVRSESVDSTADYVARGRQFANLSDDQANLNWIAAFREVANDVTKSQAWQLQTDLLSELSLRGLEVPLHEVLDEHQKLLDVLKSRIVENEGDPLSGIDAMNAFNEFRSRRNN